MSLKGKASHGTDPEAVIYMDDEAADVKKKITRCEQFVDSVWCVEVFFFSLSLFSLFKQRVLCTW